MNKQNLVNQIKASCQKLKCDLVIKNVTIIDVFNKDRFIDTVGIKDGYIIGIGDYDAENIIDGTGQYICPGLIDAHCHIESSLVSPLEYSRIALTHGITSVIADPHEIANVMGTSGIEFMLNSSKDLPFDMYFMLPSCVPGTNFENSGATLLAKDLRKFYEDERVLGLAEVMNYPAVINCDDVIIDKICDAIEHDKIIDGHGAGFNALMSNSYRTANILTDHECITAQEAIEKVRRGIYVLIREGSAAKNLNDLLPAVNEFNSNRFCLCTDDKHIDDLCLNGSIDASIKSIIKYGLKPETAIQMATLNTASAYKLKNKGAIAPGYIADFLLLDDIENFKINSVYKEGRLISKNGELIEFNHDSDLTAYNYPNSINIPDLTETSFLINIPDDISKKINVMEIIPNKLETIHRQIPLKELSCTNNLSLKNFQSSTSNDLLKIAVVERHHKTGNIGLGILKGLGIKNGAVATTIAHDSHNLIIAGTNDKDMLFAAKELKQMGGGIIIVQNGKVLASIKLEIGGLLTNRKYSEIEKDLINLHKAIDLINPDISFNLFLTLSFLSLPVIPELKITDKGLFDVKRFEFIDIISN